MYTALYRKWRSRDFGELKGQGAVTEALRNQVRSGKIGHAYLFCGTRGTGKTSAAKIFARAVNCENPQDGNPCNLCRSCKEILSGSSMNVLEMDAASNNGVEDIRKIREQVEYPPVSGRYRVYIIDEVHMLSAAAFNAFLKTLEEPPEYVVFILATTEPNRLPITILSRCQRYDFRRISSEVIAERLGEIAGAEGIPVSAEALSYIARVGDGSMRDAVSLLDQCSAFQFDREINYEDALGILGAVDSSVFSELIRALSAREIRSALSLLSELIEQGRELSQFLSDFLYYVRNLLLAKTVEDLSGLVDLSRENFQRLLEDKELFSTDELLRYIRRLSELINQLRYSPEKRVLIEIELIKLAYPETDISPEGINARIADLTRRISLCPPTGREERKPEDSAGAEISDGEEKEPKTVSLPRAQYEDLMLLKREWGNLSRELSGGPLRNAALNSRVYPARGKSGMVIATKSKASYNIISEPEAISEIEALVARRYQREIHFQVENSSDGSKESTVYVMESDLERIHFPVETVEEAADGSFEEKEREEGNQDHGQIREFLRGNAGDEYE